MPFMQNNFEEYLKQPLPPPSQICHTSQGKKHYINVELESVQIGWNNQSDIKTNTKTLITSLILNICCPIKSNETCIEIDTILTYIYLFFSLYYSFFCYHKKSFCHGLGLENYHILISESIQCQPTLNCLSKSIENP